MLRACQWIPKALTTTNDPPFLPAHKNDIAHFLSILFWPNYLCEDVISKNQPKTYWLGWYHIGWCLILHPGACTPGF
jgi:hypothetical protein